jgi:hypothetical protein
VRRWGLRLRCVLLNLALVPKTQDSRTEPAGWLTKLSLPCIGLVPACHVYRKVVTLGTGFHSTNRRHCDKRRARDPGSERHSRTEILWNCHLSCAIRARMNGKVGVMSRDRRMAHHDVAGIIQVGAAQDLRPGLRLG